jgi:hypothetical protein
VGHEILQILLAAFYSSGRIKAGAQSALTPLKFSRRHGRAISKIPDRRPYGVLDFRAEGPEENQCSG